MRRNPKEKHMADAVENQEPAGSNPEPDAPLGETGLRALEQERANAKAATAAARTAAQERDAYKAELQKIKDAELSDIDRLTKERDEIAAERDAARTEQAVYKLAAANGITEQADIDLLANVADEAQREALAKRLATPASPGTPKPDPSGGAKDERPGSIPEQIAAAEKAGDHSRVSVLKAQQLGALAATT